MTLWRVRSRSSPAVGNSSPKLTSGRLLFPLNIFSIHSIAKSIQIPLCSIGIRYSVSKIFCFIFLYIVSCEKIDELGAKNICIFRRLLLERNYIVTKFCKGIAPSHRVGAFIVFFLCFIFPPIYLGNQFFYVNIFHK